MSEPFQDIASLPPAAGPPKFLSGQFVATPNALNSVSFAEINAALQRHLRGDWGDCSPDDASANDQALPDGDRLFSVYHTAMGTKFWIITEADRSVTDVLLSVDY